MLKAIAREQVSYGGRVRWVGGLIKHNGHPFVVDCGHKHDSRLEAIECAEALFHADPGSIVADKIAEAGGR